MDLKVWDQYRDEWGAWHPHPVTMPTSLILALASSLARIDEVGTKAWVAARADLATRCREGLREMGLEPVPQAGAEANLVVAAWAEDPAAIQKHLLDHGLMISGGLDPTIGKAIRVGLMGRTATVEMVDRVLLVGAGGAGPTNGSCGDAEGAPLAQTTGPPVGDLDPPIDRRGQSLQQLRVMFEMVDARLTGGRGPCNLTHATSRASALLLKRSKPSCGSIISSSDSSPRCFRHSPRRRFLAKTRAPSPNPAGSRGLSFVSCLVEDPAGKL